MKFDLYINEYNEKYVNKQINPSIQDNFLLLGAIQLYLTNGDSEYKNFVANYVNSSISDSGEIIISKDDDLGGFVLGKSLFFLYEETKEEKYKKAIESLMKRLESLPRDKDNVFVFGEYKIESFLEAFSLVMPFYTEYETKIGKKEKYNDIIEQFKCIRKRVKADHKNELSVLVKEYYLLSLVESYQVISEQIFEHYKTLEDFIKEAIRENKTDSVLIAYGIFKACKMKALLQEKYLNRGIRMLDLKNEFEKNVLEATPENIKTIGTLIMANVQMFLLRNEE